MSKLTIRVLLTLGFLLSSVCLFSLAAFAWAVGDEFIAVVHIVVGMIALGGMAHGLLSGFED